MMVRKQKKPEPPKSWWWYLLGTPSRFGVTLVCGLLILAVIDPRIPAIIIDRLVQALVLGIGPAIGPLLGIAIALGAIAIILKGAFKRPR